MNDALQFGLQHGYVVLFVWVFAEQMGFPVPSIPFLLAVGALARAGRLNFGLALALGLVAALLADLLWYWAGARRGPKLLRLLCRFLLCRFSPKPEACVGRTQDMLTRYGAGSLLVTKFVPGLNSAAVPLAGSVRMPLPRFLLFDGLGVLLWLLGYAGLGYLFSNQLQQVAAYALQLGTWLLVILVGGLSAFIAWNYVRNKDPLRPVSPASGTIVVESWKSAKRTSGV